MQLPRRDSSRQPTRPINLVTPDAVEGCEAACVSARFPQSDKVEFASTRQVPLVVTGLTRISRSANHRGAVATNRAFRALADPTRRRILRLLRERPRTSGEIADAFQSSWPTISRHLAVLRAAKLIVSERKGQFIEYDINTTVLQEVIELLLEAVPSTRDRWRSNVVRSLPSPSRPSPR
jgi:ArsR family transcriptional regulator